MITLQCVCSWCELKPAVFSGTSLSTKHSLDSFGETVLNFSEVSSWYIIPGFFQHFPQVLFGFLSLFRRSYIPVWTLGRPVCVCQCFISSFSLQIWFCRFSSVLWIVVMVKNKNHSQSGAFQKEWSVLTPQALSTLFHSWLQGFIHPSHLSNSSSRTLSAIMPKKCPARICQSIIVFFH